jgi:hypothetical protein
MGRDTVTDEEDRLRRHLRASSAVNRQLQAQLEGSGVRAIATPGGARRDADLLDSAGASGSTVTVRRASVGNAWLEQLALHPEATKPQLVRRPDGATFVVEGRYRRRVKSGLLAAALEQRLGARRDVTDDEIDQWSESVPVEILERPTGAPFLVVGGQRIPLRGIPLPHPVNGELADQFPEGPELNISAGSLAKVRLRSALSPDSFVDRVKRSVDRRGGVVPAASTFARRQARRAKRALNR